MPQSSSGNMSLENASDEYQKLSVAPLQIKPMILHKIDEQIALAKSGKPNGLSFKTNSITDKDIIDKIAEASQAGVKTTLFVRGISCLVPGVEGYTENVEVDFHRWSLAGAQPHLRIRSAR